MQPSPFGLELDSDLTLCHARAHPHKISPTQTKLSALLARSSVLSRWAFPSIPESMLVISPLSNHRPLHRRSHFGWRDIRERDQLYRSNLSRRRVLSPSPAHSTLHPCVVHRPSTSARFVASDLAHCLHSSSAVTASSSTSPTAAPSPTVPGNRPTRGLFLRTSKICFTFGGSTPDCKLKLKLNLLVVGQPPSALHVPAHSDTLASSTSSSDCYSKTSAPPASFSTSRTGLPPTRVDSNLHCNHLHLPGSSFILAARLCDSSSQQRCVPRLAVPVSRPHWSPS